MTGIRFSSIVFNATEPRKLAEFWSRFLSVEIEEDYEVFLWLGAVTPGAPRIGIQLVEAPTEGPRRVHLDFDVDDLEEAIARAESFGATRVGRHSIEDFVWQVMADPDGNEFCLAHH